MNYMLVSLKFLSSPCDPQVPQHTPISVDCSTTGAGQLITKPITARNLNEQQRVVKAKFDLQVSYDAVMCLVTHSFMYLTHLVNINIIIVWHFYPKRPKLN